MSSIVPFRLLRTFLVLLLAYGIAILITHPAYAAPLPQQAASSGFAVSVVDFVTMSLKHPLVRWVLVLLLANFVTGVLVAAHPRTSEQFKMGALADWMYQAFMMVAAAVTVQVLVFYSTDEYLPIIQPVALATWAFVIAKLVAKVFSNLGDLGLPISDLLKDRSKTLTQPTP